MSRDSIRFLVWKVWNRTRWFWPQLKSRKRAYEELRAFGLTRKELGGHWWRP